LAAGLPLSGCGFLPERFAKKFFILSNEVLELGQFGMFRGRSRISTFPSASRRIWLDLAFDSFAIFALGAHQIVVQLEAEP
jgi:hypothetical protein